MFLLCGCATFTPRSLDELSFKERAQTQLKGKLRVTAAVLSAKESEEAFGVSLYDDGIQPIWLEIENTDEVPYWLLPASLDRDYFAPLEVAYLNHFTFGESTNKRMDQHFYEHAIGLYVPAESSISGFVFTNLDEGTKNFGVDLIGENHFVQTFTFFIPVPGPKIDHHEIDFEELYSEDEIRSYDQEGLRKALESLPCCTTNKSGTDQGDPLNLVIIGRGEDLYHAFIRSGWDETETIHHESAIKTGISFLFGRNYRYSPVSSLFVYGRPQDVALQKARGTIHERNHLRLWLTPMLVEGTPVWIGQISRDIGVRLTARTVTTHKIDPDVDESRTYLIQDLAYSQGLAKFGYVKGVGLVPLTKPRQNLTGDPYFTDGFRAVLWVTSEPTSFEKIEFLGWELPPER